VSTGLHCAVTIDVPVDVVFDALTDWSAQGQWMVGTRVEVRAGDGRSVGSELAAWTGIGVGFWDTMVITRWDPPYRIDVLHAGSVVRGTGTREVMAVPGGRSRVVWSEDVELPMGAVGRLGWPLARPLLAAGVGRSLRSLARWVESGAGPA